MNPSIRRPWAFVFLVVLTYAASAARQQPRVYNWDLLPYVASALTLRGASEEVAHALTYTIVNKGAPPGAYADLVADPLPSWLPPSHQTFRRDMLARPDHFRQQMPFYRIKPGYIAVLAFLDRLGIPLLTAGYVLSWAGFVAAGTIVFLWLSRRTTDLLACVVAGTLVVNPAISAYASWFTPDMLSLALLLGAAWAVTAARAHPYAIVATSIAAISVRTENVMVLVPLLAIVAYGDLARRRLFAGVGIAIVVEYFVIGRWAGDYGYPTLFWNTLVEPLLTPAEVLTPFTLDRWGAAVSQGLPVLTSNWNLAGSVVALVAIAATRGIPDRRRAFLAAVVGVNVVRFFLLPFADPRYVLAPTVLALVLGAELIHARVAAITPAPPPGPG